MKTELCWTDTIKLEASETNCSNTIYCTTYHPNGTQLLVGFATRIHIYSALKGECIKKLKGHKESVYCLAYAKNGEIFASGGADKYVVIWNSNGEGKLKYSHNDTIQSVAFNPVSNILLSCTTNDFGLWSQTESDVKKTKVNSRITCCSWTNDGQHFALGFYNGTISIRTKSGKEKVSITRTAPIWTLSWNPSRDEDDVLAVGSWDETLSFYHLSGQQLGRDKKLDGDPMSLNYFTNGEFLCTGGTDKRVNLWTKEGVKLGEISQEDDWVWSVSHRPQHNHIAVGTNSGKISVYQVNFSTIHAMYSNLYAFRDFMTDVVVQNLETDRKLRIRCRDYVKKIGLYETKLAVQLYDRIHIYDILSDDNTDEMHYKLRDKIVLKIDCDLMLATSRRIILCNEKTLSAYDFQGNKEREWHLDALVRYVKVIGGPIGREAILVGLKNGSVLKIFVDNSFPIQLLKINSSIRCLDISSSKLKLAVVDEQNNCIVYDLKNKKFLFQETNAITVAWNTNHEDMLCFSSNGVLYIKTANFPVTSVKIQGVAVGFKGSVIHALNNLSISTIDVPLSISMQKHLDNKDFENAYHVACLGVTDGDWYSLGMNALANFNFEIAKNAFTRIRDIKLISLITKFEQLVKQKDFNPAEFQAEICAYQGKFDEAAQHYLNAKKPEAAIDLLCDLRLFEQAKKLANSLENVNIQELILRQAKAAEDDGDLRGAAEMYIAAGEIIKSIVILGDNNWLDQLMELCYKLDSNNDTKAITLCSNYFKKANKYDYAKETYVKLNDYEQLIKLMVETNQWSEAFKLLKTQPQFTELVYYPYAQYLIINDKYDEAQKAFQKANKPLEAMRMIEELGNNAITERRYSDAAFYYFEVAIENIKLVPKLKLESEVSLRIESHEKFLKLARIYFAYDFIYKFSEYPFNSMELHHLFNMCIFLLASINSSSPPRGVSKVTIYIVLSRLCMALGAFKLAREVYQKLHTLKIPKHLIDEIDHASLCIHSKPHINNENLSIICYRCSHVNPFLGLVNDCCINCSHPFIRSFYSFDVLPMVEFSIDAELTEEQIEKLMSKSSLQTASSQSLEMFKDDGKVQSLSFDDRSNSNNNNERTLFNQADAFSRLILTLDYKNKTYVPLKVSPDMLKTFGKEEIYTVNFSPNSVSKYIKSKYFRNVFPNYNNTIVKCNHCNHFFHEDHFEFEKLKTGGCIFCKRKL